MSGLDEVFAQSAQLQNQLIADNNALDRAYREGGIAPALERLRKSIRYAEQDQAEASSDEPEQQQPG